MTPLPTRKESEEPHGELGLLTLPGGKEVVSPLTLHELCSGKAN